MSVLSTWQKTMILHYLYTKRNASWWLDLDENCFWLIRSYESTTTMKTSLPPPEKTVIVSSFHESYNIFSE